MVDLKNQYLKIKSEIDFAISQVLDSTEFINGKEVKIFQQNLEHYLEVKNVIPCANGTDALQIALMSLDLQPFDEIIIPSFTFAAAAEVTKLLNLTPIFVDVDFETFNIDVQEIEKNISPKTKAIIPVHLFGQAANIEEILQIAAKYDLFVVEDAAQSLGTNVYFSNGTTKKTGTIGHLGTTSFFPTKNLSCYGDGGAIFTNNDFLAEKCRIIAQHGAKTKYFYERIGINSRLDTLQAAILNVKLKYLENFNAARQEFANFYDSKLKNNEKISIPVRNSFSNHIFHQYTIVLNGINRDKVRDFLQKNEIPSMIYYPVPLHFQKPYISEQKNLLKTEKLCDSVLSLPMHTELNVEQQNKICEKLLEAVSIPDFSSDNK